MLTKILKSLMLLCIIFLLAACSFDLNHQEVQVNKDTNDRLSNDFLLESKKDYGTKYYTLELESSINGHVLDSFQSGYSNAFTDVPDNSNLQKWRFHYLGDSIYRLQQKGSNKYLAVKNTPVHDNSVVTVEGPKKGITEWRFNHQGDNVFIIQDIYGRCMDGYVNDDLEPYVVTYDCEAYNTTQRWKLKHAETVFP